MEIKQLDHVIMIKGNTHSPFDLTQFLLKDFPMKDFSSLQLEELIQQAPNNYVFQLRANSLENAG